MKLKYRLLKIALSLAVLMVMLNFSIRRFEDSKLEQFKINISQSNTLGFVNSSNVKEAFYAQFPDTHNVRIKDLKVQEIENNLRKNPYIDSVNVYLDQNKNLNFYITQKQPIIRIHSGSDYYYIDQHAQKTPISTQFSLPTFMVEGKIKEEEYPALIELQGLINEDKLLKKHIVGLRKQNDNSFILLVNVNAFTIELGDLTDLPQKLKNLKAFYQQYLQYVEPDTYSKISLKYKNQIVATKK